MNTSLLAFRTSILNAMGANSEETGQLLVYNENIFRRHSPRALPHLPLESEMHIPVWRAYVQQTQVAGAFEALRPHLLQLHFPIRPGISQTKAYQQATRQGKLPVSADMPGLELDAPETVQVYIRSTPAGAIPIILAQNRNDFVALLRALTMRNEPQSVPDSMGACIVSGYNNWHRIRQYREHWQARNPFHNTPARWNDEFRRIIPHKELYQDTFILLSAGPYSGVAARELGFSELEWRRLSLIIREEHECTHYFTRRIFHAMRNNLLDEMIADYAGIVAAMGCFRADWMLRFMGLERFPEYREGGRLQNYRGTPALSDGAFGVLQKLVKHSAENLERFHNQHAHKLNTVQERGQMIMALADMTLEELASDEMSIRLVRNLAQLTSEKS